MLDLLLDAAGRYADSRADGRGIAKTPIPGLAIVRSTRPRDLEPVAGRPAIGLVLQGALNAANGSRSVAAGPGETVLLDPAAPTMILVARASLAEPFVAVMMEIDLALVAELSVELDAARSGTENTDDEVTTAFHRLLALLRRPQSVSVLLKPMLRELHYWVLWGKHGAAIGRLRKPHGAASRVARAVALIRSEYRNTLPVERLAKESGMSTSAFHEHFRAATSMTPLQFQKQLRLTEARRLMVAEGKSASTAAFAVGYQSVPQFTREYRRTFGLPPARETAPARSKATRQVSTWRARLRRSAMALCPHVDEATALPA